MVNIFQIAAERLVDVGFYNFLLPFILFTTVLYAVLKKTGILGDSIIIHGIISVSVGLLVFGVPVILGSSLVQPLTAFLTQAVIAILVFVVGLLVASFFYPNIMEKLPEIFKPPGPGGWLVWLVVGLAAALGLFTFIGKPIGQLFKAFKIPGELLSMTIVVVIVLIIFIIITLTRQVER